MEKRNLLLATSVTWNRETFPGKRNIFKQQKIIKREGKTLQTVKNLAKTFQQ